MRKKIIIIFGTRPEVIKFAPLIWEFRKHPDKFELKIINTGQHKEMTNPLLEFFNIVPDENLAIMKKNQSLTELNATAMLKVESILNDFMPDLVFVQGDTTTVFSAAMAAFYQKIGVAHLEAGLRTHNKFSPFPEELNRYFTSYMSSWHFAPTTRAVENLKKENITENVFHVGNTAIDTLLHSLSKVEAFYDKKYKTKYHQISFDRKIILLTAHRRENHGQPLMNICKAAKEIVERNSDVEVVYPVHYNPNVREIVYKSLINPKIHLLEPLDYKEFIWFMQKSYIILTDSGGVQEEAPSINKPVLVLRENTERPESVEAGLSILVGSNSRLIVNELEALLADDMKYAQFTNKPNPYGDGKASEKIVNVLMENL